LARQHNFFARKRPWSTIKDQVLASYLPPYFAKVARLGKPILLVDAFAGAGMFQDGALGSPLLMCREAERLVPGRYRAIFVNKELADHRQLVTNLAAHGLTESTKALHADARQLLQELPATLGAPTLFLYLDPFGLRGCEFQLLQPFLSRGVHMSTEILLLMHMPIVHRLARARQMHGGILNPRVAAGRPSLLTQIFGGTYWQDILWDMSLPLEEQQRQLMECYTAKLREYLPFAHFCPVRQSQESRLKYYLVFASRHPDATLLMNDVMAKAYHEHMHRARNQGTLWEGADWRHMRTANDFEDDLDAVVLGVVGQRPVWTRDELWHAIVADHFMRYMHSEYLETLKQLAGNGKIVYEPDPRTKKRNRHSRLALAAQVPVQHLASGTRN
jgi:three-Cys-motif partner protein